jgi:hypothetical protein
MEAQHLLGKRHGAFVHGEHAIEAIADRRKAAPLHEATALLVWRNPRSDRGCPHSFRQSRRLDTIATVPPSRLYGQTIMAGPASLRAPAGP